MALSIFFLIICQIAYSDLAKRRIFNISIVLVFFLGVWLVFFEKLGFSNRLIYSFFSFFVFFIFFIFFYVAGVMGAGDVKYGAVLAFCFGVENFLIILTLSLIISFLYVYFKSLIGLYGSKIIILSAVVNVSKGNKKNIPYGAFLSMSSIFHVLKQGYI